MALKTKLVASAVVMAVMGFIIFSTTAYTNNAGKAGYTGSPGETTCRNCHNSFNLNEGDGSISISSPDLTGWEYQPGTTYTINVTVRKPGVSKYGFGFEALLSSGANGGLINTSSSNNAKTMSASISGNTRTNAVHKQPNNTGADSLVFTFNWTAPAAGTGDVTFYAVGNATNSSNTNAGDYIYSTSLIVTEATGTAIKSPQTENLSIYPNPAKDVIKLTLPQQFKIEKSVLSIFDSKGKLYYQNNEFKSLYPEESFDISFLPSGIYFIKIKNSNIEFNKKILIMR
ncbi:MAG: T9SS type A sorting domain-containing protein [Bacteroidia bacterium]|nr:T9SS type A sorting domain-containing protein [Bacteroidia bacterium]MCZ2247698.1 T9SS type A sorting domain-containing protein [Bacteroidia bacterium]